MNRFVLGASLLLVSPFVAGCSNFYLVNPPAPAATPTPLPPTPTYPMDPAEGVNTTLTTPSQGIKLNGTAPLPTSFRAADIIYVPRVANDPANCVALLVLQSASTDASGNTVLGTADVNNPVRLAGLIVPGPNGQAAAGLQDPDLNAMQNQAYNQSLKTMRDWAQGPLTIGVSATGTPTPTKVPTVRPAGGPAPTPTALPRAYASRPLDVYQDPRFPIDSDNRRLVQIMFTSEKGISVKSAPTPGQPATSTQTQVIVPAGAQLSLNRMMLRSGWAVVDLYSATCFDQQTWLLDEAYARHRKLGLWGLQLNGKKLSLQQRAPVPSTGTGAQSSIKVTTNNPPTTRPVPAGTARPGTARPSGVTPSATQAPSSLAPKVSATQFPRVMNSSGTSVQLGPSSSSVLPPPSQSAPASASAATSNTAAGPGMMPAGG